MEASRVSSNFMVTISRRFHTVVEIYVNMAGKIKKRKLPKDLSDASTMAVSHLNVSKKISEACQVLRSFSVTEVHLAIRSVDLSPDDAVLFLVVQYGSKMC